MRNDPRLFDTDDDHKFHRIFGKALDMKRKRHVSPVPQTGPYSGLTKQQLAASRTCETDWY